MEDKLDKYAHVMWFNTVFTNNSLILSAYSPSLISATLYLK